ncbi:MAG: HD domain-containing protein [Gammaproteobacteria bacterium]|nr:HD domain-containing protein [Gammaproteobacteria bacterium]
MKGLEVQAMNFHPNSADGYMDHLGALEGEHAVVAAEDMRNEQGVLLVRKGTPINASLAARLAGHHLEKPVHELVQVGRTLNNNSLYEEFGVFLVHYEDFYQVHAKTGFDNVLRHFCFVRSFPHGLMQRLTVMRARLPRVFERSLFSAWLGGLIAEELHLPAPLIYDTFVAGLFHDVGLVHLPYELVEKRSGYSDTEWAMMQTHVAGSTRLMAECGRFTGEAIKAVAEHHERCDGTGFPQGKSESQLGIVGQIVGLADILFQLRVEQYAGTDKTLADTLPYLRVNAKTYFFPTFQATFHLFQRAGLRSAGANQDNYGELRHDVVTHSDSMQRLFSALLRLAESLGEHTEAKTADALRTLVERVIHTLRASGLGSEELNQWLHSLGGESDAETCQELFELDAILFESLWLVRRVIRHGHDLLQHGPKDVPAEFSRQLGALLDQLDKLAGACWQSYNKDQAEQAEDPLIAALGPDEARRAAG